MKPAESDHPVCTLRQVGGSAGSRTFTAVKHTGHLRTAGMVTSEASLGCSSLGNMEVKVYRLHILFQLSVHTCTQE